MAAPMPSIGIVGDDGRVVQLARAMLYACSAWLYPSGPVRHTPHCTQNPPSLTLRSHIIPTRHAEKKRNRIHIDRTSEDTQTPALCRLSTLASKHV